MSNNYNPNFGNFSQPFNNNMNQNFGGNFMGNNQGGNYQNIGGMGGNNFSMMNQQSAYPDKNKQIQQLKNTYANLEHKVTPQANGISYETIALSIVVKTSSGPLDIPVTIIIPPGYPDIVPSIFINKYLRHNLFESNSQTLELKVANVMKWTNQNTLSDLVLSIKTLFEKDPPQQDKIVEEVNKLLAEIKEQHFRDLALSDKFSNKTVDELKALQSANFEEVICTSKEYKVIVQSLINITSFNERVANEVLSKSDSLETQKQQLSIIGERIQSLLIDYKDKTEKCNKFKEAFSKQNISDLLERETKKLNKEIGDFESNAAEGYFSNPVELFQNYYDMKKKYHTLEIMKNKLPTINFNSK